MRVPGAASTVSLDSDSEGDGEGGFEGEVDPDGYFQQPPSPPRYRPRPSAHEGDGDAFDVLDSQTALRRSMSSLLLMPMPPTPSSDSFVSALPSFLSTISFSSDTHTHSTAPPSIPVVSPLPPSRATDELELDRSISGRSRASSGAGYVPEPGRVNKSTPRISIGIHEVEGTPVRETGGILPNMNISNIFSFK